MIHDDTRVRGWVLGSLLLLPVGAGIAAAGEAVECGGSERFARQALGAPFDTIRGGDPRSYAPDPQVDFTHLRLELDFADLRTRSFEAVETIRFRTPAAPVERLRLNAVELAIQSVTGESGAALPYAYDDEHLTVRFEPALSADSDSAIVIRYRCHEPKSGMTFALPDEHYPDRPLVVHTQGQGEENRHWMAAHDYPNERCTTEILATVPSQYKVLSNGRLVERADAGSGRTRWHYNLEQPHVAYLISLVIGELEVFSQEWRGKPVEYWVPPGQKGDALRTFQKTPEMIEVFSQRFGLDYPYAKYAQSVVPLFKYGGMENTSCTTLYESCMLSAAAAADEDLEDLISHELAHQWFGDALTCNGWEHIWLNEGFATYSQEIWMEASRGLEEYEYRTWANLRRVSERDKVDSVGGITSKHYGDPWGTGGERPGSDPYSKGSAVLHMLRRTLGDEAFFRALQDYTRSQAWTLVETDQFRRAMEQHSGRSLTQFFEQYVYRGGAPRLTVSYDWRDREGDAVVRFEQTQPIEQAYPAFEMDIDVWLVLAGGRIEKRVARVDGRFGELTVHCGQAPTQVCVDPRGCLLAVIDWRVPGSLLVESATHGPTLAARLHATRALSGVDRDDARSALSAILRDRAALRGLRQEAAASLGRMNLAPARELLLAAVKDADALGDPRVLRFAVEAVGGYRDAAVAAVLVELVRSSKYEGVVGAACGGLAHQDVGDAVIAALVSAAQRTSFDDRIRKAAVSALGDLADARGIDAARSLAAYGAPYRSRSTGIEALARIGRANPTLKGDVRRFLEPLLNDPQDKPANSVPGALGRLGDADAIAALQAFADGAADDGRRRRARSAIDTLNREQGDSEVIRDLRERIDRLEQYRREQERDREAKDEPAAAASQPRP